MFPSWWTLVAPRRALACLPPPYITRNLVTLTWPFLTRAGKAQALSGRLSEPNCCINSAFIGYYQKLIPVLQGRTAAAALDSARMAY